MSTSRISLNPTESSTGLSIVGTKSKNREQNLRSATKKKNDDNEFLKKGFYLMFPKVFADSVHLQKNMIKVDRASNFYFSLTPDMLKEYTGVSDKEITDAYDIINLSPKNNHEVAFYSRSLEKIVMRYDTNKLHFSLSIQKTVLSLEFQSEINKKTKIIP